MPAKNKFRRYSNLLRDFSNWPRYLWFKAFSGADFFDFRLRNSFTIHVPRQMLSPFRECFFDQIYLKHIPRDGLALDRPVIVDIGANAGFFSLFMFSQYPNATVYSFEPMPFNFQALTEYHTAYPSFDWHIHQQAVSNSNEPVTLHATYLDAFTTMATVFDVPGNSQQIEVEATSLSDIILENAINRIDILKLDCEGAEYSILYALPPEILKKIGVLMIETHQGTQGNENTLALKSYLEQHGFALHFLAEEKSGYIWAWMPDRNQRT